MQVSSVTLIDMGEDMAFTKDIKSVAESYQIE